MKIEIPTWKETNERQRQLSKTDRTIMQNVLSGHKLNPVEQFIYDNEPSKDPTRWRKSLTYALENAFMCEEIITNHLSPINENGTLKDKQKHEKYTAEDIYQLRKDTGCSLYEASTFLNKKRLVSLINNAQSVEQLKPILIWLLETIA